MKFNPIFTVVVFVLLFTVSASSCKRNSTLPENVIYYYPQKNVYYDRMRSNFYYSLDSARSWDSMAFAGPGYGRGLGVSVPISRAAIHVWANNDSHRRAYNGILLNIINENTLSLTRADSIKKIKTVVKSKARQDSIIKEEPPKKGLKKFFNKLFGKKKKADKDKKQ